MTKAATCAIAIALATGWITPAQAQDAASVQRELAAMREQMARMSQRIDELEGQLASARLQASAASDTAGKAVAVATAIKDNPPATAAWKGAPLVESKGGWSFKPRGRMQIDAGNVSRPAGITDNGLGTGTELRRVYLGAEGTLPGGFGYRAEFDMAQSSVEITDLYLTYQVSKAVTLTLGQHKPFWSTEEVTSDLFTSFTERAAFNSAFGFERRLGASATVEKGPVLVQAGAFTDNVADLNDDGNNSWSLDGRAVFMPKLGTGQLHLGGSLHYRELKDAAASVRYRVRPFIHTPDVRFIDTGAITALSETGYGLEAAYIRGPLHVAGETHWQKVDRVGGANPTFFGGYAELGYFLTKGDTRAYKKGAFDRIKPVAPLGKGGIGAVQVTVRYDRLDLSDAGIVGGRQNGYGVSLLWVPTDYVRFMLNYGRMQYDDAALVATGGDRSYGVDAFGARAQLDF